MACAQGNVIITGCAEINDVAELWRYVVSSPLNAYVGEYLNSVIALASFPDEGFISCVGASRGVISVIAVFKGCGEVDAHGSVYLNENSTLSVGVSLAYLFGSACGKAFGAALGKNYLVENYAVLAYVNVHSMLTRLRDIEIPGLITHPFSRAEGIVGTGNKLSVVNVYVNRVASRVGIACQQVNIISSRGLKVYRIMHRRSREECIGYVVPIFSVCIGIFDTLKGTADGGKGVVFSRGAEVCVI